jgi:LysM repeat protein
MRAILLLLLCCGCVSHFAALRGGKDQDAVVEELRTEIADVKHTLHGTEVELRLLEEKIDSQEGGHVVKLQEQIATLQRKLAALERVQEKMVADIRTLSTHANQTSTSLSHYRDKIQELDRHKTDTPRLKSGRYTVKSGDTLEKIARKHDVSIEELKRANQLESDRILLGQDLVIPGHG